MTRRLLAATVAALCLASACGGKDGANSEFERLAADKNFSNGREAAGALATIAERAINEQRTCREGAGGRSPECSAYGVLAAWAQVSAVQVPHCGRADTFDVRQNLLTLLDDVEAVVEGENDAVPKTPPLTDCRRR